VDSKLPEQSLKDIDEFLKLKGLQRIVRLLVLLTGLGLEVQVRVLVLAAVRRRRRRNQQQLLRSLSLRLPKKSSLTL
jgi:hypothetical protein